MSKQKHERNNKKTGVIVISLLAVFFLLFSTMGVMVIYLGNNPTRTQPPILPPERVLQQTGTSNSSGRQNITNSDESVIFKGLPVQPSNTPDTSQTSELE